jgi:hypothetical protein
LAVEIFVRIFLTDPANAVPDPAIGWRFPSNASFLTFTDEAGPVRIRTNALGFNDGAIAPKAGRARVAFLGDSFVEALHVTHDENMAGRLGALRADLVGLNAGRSGLDPLLDTTLITRAAPVVAPDYLVMVVNDTDCNDIVALDPVIDYCGENVCGYRTPAFKDSAAKKAAKTVLEHSALLTYLSRRYGAAMNREVRNLVGRKQGAPTQAQTCPAKVEQLLQVAFVRLKAIAPVLVVYLPSMEFVANRSARENASNTKDIMRQAALAAGVSFVDAGPALANVYTTTGAPPFGFQYSVPGQGHLNARGHAAIAELVARQLPKT